MRILKLNILLLFLLTLLSAKVFSQSYITDENSRFINHQSLLLIEKYKYSYDFSSLRDYDNFHGLFLTDKTEIINNILPNNSLNQKLNIKDYLDTLNKYYKEMYLEIIPTQIDKIEAANSKRGHVKIHATQIISGILFDIDYNYTDTLNLVFKINYNLRDSSFNISDIKPIKDYGKYSLLSAQIKKNKKKIEILKNDSVYINGKKVYLDNNGQYLIKRLNSDTMINIESANEELIGNYNLTLKSYNNSKPCIETIDKNIRCFTFKYPYYSFGITAGYSNQLMLNSKSENLNTNFSNNSSYNVGVNLAYIISRKNNIKISLGAYYKSYSYSLTQASYSETYNTTDPDNSSYQRTDSVFNIEEQNELSFINIPIILEKSFKLFKGFYLNIGIGASYYYNLSSYYNINADAKYSGLYNFKGEGYDFNVIMDDKSVYDFGYYENINNNDKEDKLYISKGIIAFNSKVGISKSLSKQLELELKLTYNRGFTNIFDTSTGYLSKNHEEINSLSEINPAFNLNEIFLNAGLNYKF